MNHPHETREDSIEKVLTALRTADPPTGMQHRVFEAIQARAESSSRSPWQRRLPWTLFAQRLVMFSAIGLIGVAVILVTAKERVPQVSLLRPGFSPAAEIKSATKSKVNFDTVAPPSAHMSRASTAASRPSQKPEQVAQQLESYPAPPLPLTEQEQLLLRLAHGHDEANFAILNPAKQEVQIAKESAEFQDFFKDTHIRIAPQPPQDEPNSQSEERGQE